MGPGSHTLFPVRVERLGSTRRGLEHTPPLASPIVVVLGSHLAAEVTNQVREPGFAESSKSAFLRLHNP